MEMKLGDLCAISMTGIILTRIQIKDENLVDKEETAT